MNFFYNFYNRHAELKKNPIYFFGESYGGHYVPHFARRFITNSNLTNLNFKGIGVGNGWVNPPIQNFDYETMMFSAG
jgi:carboxypeptidase C (cathepsin A)